jgi:hypothetical protein
MSRFGFLHPRPLPEKRRAKDSVPPKEPPTIMGALIGQQGNGKSSIAIRYINGPLHGQGRLQPMFRLFSLSCNDKFFFIRHR